MGQLEWQDLVASDSVCKKKVKEDCQISGVDKQENSESRDILSLQCWQNIQMISTWKISC